MHQLLLLLLLVGGFVSLKGGHYCQLDEQIRENNINQAQPQGSIRCEEIDIDWADTFSQPCWYCNASWLTVYMFAMVYTFCRVGPQDSGTEICAFSWFRSNKTITDNTLDGQCTVPVDRELCNVSTYEGIVGCTPTNDPYGKFMDYNPQESLENTINTYKYHGYTARGTPNCPLNILQYIYISIYSTHPLRFQSFSHASPRPLQATDALGR